MTEMEKNVGNATHPKLEYDMFKEIVSGTSSKIENAIDDYLYESLVFNRTNIIPLKPLSILRGESLVIE